MRQSILRSSGIAALLAACASPAFAQSGLELSLDLPSGLAWTLAADRVVGQAYSKEWIPAGENLDSRSWLITQQKVPVERGANAENFLATIYQLTAEGCRLATHDVIEQTRIGSLRVAIGRTQCGQRLDGSFGTFSDRLVVVEDGFAYVITSELKTPPMLVDGVLSFGKSSSSEARAASDRFLEREALSRNLLRDSVRID